MRGRALRTLLICCGSLAACSPQSTVEHEDGGALKAVDTGARNESEGGPLPSCAAIAGAAPQTIADVVARIDQLPVPSIPCLVASLPRPLALVASISPVSAQPSTGPDNPRIFILNDTLTLSVLPAGPGQDVLELGERVTPLRSLKAELHFPIERPVPASKPYEGLAEEGQTFSVCGSCHGDEQAHATIPGAFVSNMLRPARYADSDIADVSALRAACDDRDGEAPQCEMLRALFDYGQVRQGVFEPAVEVGY